VGDEVGVDVLLVAGAAVPLPATERVVSVPQDNSNSDDECSGSDDMDNNNGGGSGSDDGEDKATRIPFKTTPSRIMWFKCPICVGEEYDYEDKVVLHALEVIKQNVGTPDAIE
jgi:hypothetical protein